MMNGLSQTHLFEGAYQAEYVSFYGIAEIKAAVDPDGMFDELQTYLTRFMRPINGEKWICPVSGRKRGKRWFWTQLVPFRAAEFSSFGLQWSGLLEPLTPVWPDLLLRPWPESEHYDYPSL